MYSGCHPMLCCQQSRANPHVPLHHCRGGLWERSKKELTEIPLFQGLHGQEGGSSCGLAREGPRKPEACRFQASARSLELQILVTVFGRLYRAGEASPRSLVSSASTPTQRLKSSLGIFIFIRGFWRREPASRRAKKRPLKWPRGRPLFSHPHRVPQNRSIAFKVGPGETKFGQGHPRDRREPQESIYIYMYN